MLGCNYGYTITYPASPVLLVCLPLMVTHEYRRGLQSVLDNYVDRLIHFGDNAEHRWLYIKTLMKPMLYTFPVLHLKNMYVYMFVVSRIIKHFSLTLDSQSEEREEGFLIGVN